MILEGQHCAYLICALGFIYGLAWLRCRTRVFDRLYDTIVYLKSLIV